MVQRRLINVVEEIMRFGESEKLTAGAMTAAAGIARNSIYRYVDSVDDLYGLVLARHLPVWIDAVAAELGAVEAPIERIVVWVRANLQQAVCTRHDWLMGLSRSITPSPTAVKVMNDFRAVMRDSVVQAWAAPVQDLVQLWVAAGLIRDLLEAGFRQLDSGMPVDVVVNPGEKAARGPVAGITGRNS